MNNEEFRMKARSLYEAVCRAEGRQPDPATMPYVAAVLQKALEEHHDEAVEGMAGLLRERAASSKFRLPLEYAADAIEERRVSR